MTDDKLFYLRIISPNRILYEGNVELVEMNTVDGEIGVYKKHIPLTVVLEPGIVYIKEAEGTKKAAVHAGFAEILQDQVTILAEIAEWPDEIDINRAKEAQIRAQRRMKAHDSNVNLDRAKMALRRSLIRLELKNKDK